MTIAVASLYTMIRIQQGSKNKFAMILSLTVLLYGLEMTAQWLFLLLNTYTSAHPYFLFVYQFSLLTFSF
jgi:hypothetical protein